MNERGHGIASVLVVMAVLACLALTLASTTTFHLRLANRTSQNEQARNLAESVLAKAKDLMVDNQEMAENPVETDVITAQFSPESPQGILTFYPPLAEELGVPVSVNNLRNDASVVLADGRSLPPFSAYLAARAEYAGVPKIVETVIQVPLYKYAIATSGPINSSGKLLVASINSETDLSGGLASIPPDELEPGHLAAFGTEDTSLDSESAEDGSLITGDVISSGGVSLGPYTDVRGAVEQGQEREDLPELTVTDYDPQNWAGLQTLGQEQYLDDGSSMILEGTWKRQGDLLIQKELNLDGAYIYVDGDVELAEGVGGTGSIFATGDIVLGKASNFDAEDVQALVAGGSITVSGGDDASDRDTSMFHGILFSHGGMTLNNVTVVGSVVNNSPDRDQVMELNNVGLLSNPDVLEFDFGIPMGPSSDVGNAYVDEEEYFFRAASDTWEGFYSPEDGEFRIPDLEEIPLSLFRRDYAGGARVRYRATFPNVQDAWDWLLEQHGEPGDEYDDEGHPIDHFQALQAASVGFRAKFIEALHDANEFMAQSRHPSMAKGKFTLEPNQFVPFASKVRVLWSRELPAES